MDDFSKRVEGFTTKGSLGYLLRRAHKLMSQQAEQVFAGRDLTLSQWIVLKMIDEGSVGTPGGGSGGGAHKISLNKNLPRLGIDGRLGVEVTVKMLAWPSRPPRCDPVSGTLWKLEPVTPLKP